MAADKETKEVVKVKKPTALKRDLQSQKRNARNRAYKAKVNTAMRSLEKALEEKNPTITKENLSVVFSLMDKGVKKGIFKLNKAARVKSRLVSRSKQLSA